MAKITKSAKLFLEREGIRTTQRRPNPRLDLNALPINTMSLARPLPLPSTVPPASQLTVNDPWHLGPPPES